jgi:hypothetical protein
MDQDWLSAASQIEMSLSAEVWRMARIMRIASLMAAPIVMMSCTGYTPAIPKPEKYQVHRLTEPMLIDGKWNKPQWQNIAPIEIKNHMGQKPEHRPRTEAKALYDDKYIYVIFCVEDRYVRAVAQEYHGEVWKDSCVEFFFTPGEDVSLGYFNLEVNCGGTALFHFQKVPWKDYKTVDLEEMQRLEIAHSMPKIVEPEIAKPTTWTIEYRIPLMLLEKYCKVVRPGRGAIWRANFYKIADATSHPHYLTWSVVDNPKPDFHRPQSFGILEFM